MLRAGAAGLGPGNLQVNVAAGISQVLEERTQ